MTIRSGSTILCEGKFLKLVKNNNWEWVERPQPNTVAVLPITDDGELILISQYREPTKSKMIEIPAGIVGDVRIGETPEEAVKVELLEETGYEAETIIDVGSAYASPGLTTECNHFFIAYGLTQVNAGGGDASEDITVYKVDYSNIHCWLKSMFADGYLVDMKVYAAIWFALERGYWFALERGYL